MIEEPSQIAEAPERGQDDTRTDEATSTSYEDLHLDMFRFEAISSSKSEIEWLGVRERFCCIARMG